MEKPSWAVFSAAGPARHRPQPISARELITVRRDPPVGAVFPQSHPAPRLRVLASQIPVIEPTTRRVLAPPQPPPVHLPS
jgi:hypothetical protein